ncbi:hypothetical protein KIPE111705_12755 [Kibdelosporangium persicum]|uniref:Allene oxide cyclase barrel-like domain-containing protein n=1 Tax=Kibdelosporangium persicum TaxID=2698649 RepID=A0ABX2F9K3_9PSEU|nr:hypothetical protein [Kibdelosporangium persicum]NRN68048.1 hypothetical protein [Kibdelosporangium persicum]
MQVQSWLVLALTGALVTGGVAGADAVDHRASTVEVTAKRTLMSAPAAPAVGAGFVSGGQLFDAQGAVQVGEGYSHCGVLAVSVTVPPEVTTHCTSTFRLKDGELHLSGIRVYKTIALGFGDTTVAVVGGTGAYTNARGEGKVTRANTQDVAYRFIFTLPD